MAINSALILSTDTTLLTVPVGIKYAVTTLLICNYSPTTDALNASSFSLHVIKGIGGVKSNTNKILNEIAMPAQETFTFSVERLILEEGDRLVLNSPDPDKLSATVSYLEV
jgi:hypothetical protein